MMMSIRRRRLVTAPYNRKREEDAEESTRASRV